MVETHTPQTASGTEATAKFSWIPVSLIIVLLIIVAIGWLATDKLQHPVDNRFANPKGQFNSSLKTFMARADISPEEKANTLAQISCLIEADEGVVSEQERKTAARQVLYHAAEPDSTWQGAHPTCGANSIAHLLYLRSPSIAAEIVRECLLTGKWQGKDGKVVHIPNQDLPINGSDGLFPIDNGHRSYALQISDAVIMNDIGIHVVPPMHYIEGEFHQVGGKGAGSTTFKQAWQLPDGELVDAEKPGTGNFSQSGGVTPWQAADELNRLTGQTQTILRLRAFASNDPAPPTADNAALNDHGFLYYESLEDLENRLWQLKKAGQLPIIACVSFPWLIKISGGAERPEKSPTKPADEDHFVAVDDFRPAQSFRPAMVRVHDSNESKMAAWLPIKRFYDASR